MAKTKSSGVSGYLMAGAVLGLGMGAVGFGAAGLGMEWPASARVDEDVGTIPALYAAPAEHAEDVELGPGETLGRVLWNEADLDPNEQEALLDAFRTEASPRRLSPGTRVTLRRRVDGWLRGVDVALDPDRTLRLDRGEPLSWAASVVETPITTDTLFIAGAIEQLLWTSVLDHPDLADVPALDRVAMIHHLDQIFQWQVDFSRQIREGDTFRFVFERRVRPDGSMRDGHVVAAELVNQGVALHAAWFDPNGDGEGTYYDLEGQSVRRAFLRKPLEFRYISSRFSPGRFHPILQRWRAHQGVDYAANRGTPVMATADGVVTTAGVNGGYGNLLEIRHPNGFTTRYGHLNGFGDGVRQGARVRQGQVVAYVGSTGLATGPHLHYELRRNGQARDPLAIELPPGDPVPEDQWDAWENRLATSRELLGRLPDAEVLRMAANEAGAGSSVREGSDGAASEASDGPAAAESDAVGTEGEE